MRAAGIVDAWSSAGRRLRRRRTGWRDWPRRSRAPTLRQSASSVPVESCGSDQHGKPYVLGLDATTPVHVSLSRAGQLAILAVSDAGPVGVDVEWRAARGSPDVSTWVRKESVIKATGHGLTVDPDLIDVTPHGSRRRC